MICPNCGKSIADKSVFCMHCNTNFQVGTQANTETKYVYVEKPAKKSGLTCSGMLSAFIFIIAGLFVLSMFSGDDESEARPTSSKTQGAATSSSETVEFEPTQIGDDFLMTEFNANQSLLSTTIDGVIKNVSDKDYSFVSITFALYDKNGNKLEEISDEITGLKAGETWKFEVVGTADAASMEASDFVAF